MQTIVGRPRIGFVSALQGSPWGGSEELWSGAAARLAPSEAIIGVNTTWWPHSVPQVEALARQGCLVTQSLVYESGTLYKRAVRRIRHVFAGPNTRWLKTFRPDLVVLSMDSQISGLAWMQECGRLGIPYVLLVQCAADVLWPDDVFAAQLADGYERAEICFFVSQENVEFVRWQLAIRLTGARVVRNPFNISYEAAPPWPTENGVFRLANVARLEPLAKGQDVLFRVLSEPKWRARPLTVDLFGSGPNAHVLARLREMHALDKVTLKGFTEDIVGVWAEHHALVLPSRYEGLPLALVEAMLCGRPAIVSGVAGNTEMIEDGVTGFVAASPTPSLLDDALERAWARRFDWQAMGRLAALSARALVPDDPAGEFAAEILLLALQQKRLVPAKSS